MPKPTTYYVTIEMRVIAKTEQDAEREANEALTVIVASKRDRRVPRITGFIVGEASAK